MPDKKNHGRHRGQGEIRDAAPKYETRPMSEVFWMAFQSLSEDDRVAVVSRLLDDPDFREELLDVASIIESEGEENIPYQQVREELIRDGLL